MIQFNLLPDVKQEYIRVQRTKHLVIAFSTIASVAAIVIFLILILVVDVGQKKIISNLNSTINTNSVALKNTPHLSTILTLQSQLNSLNSLNSQNPVASRMFSFLSQLTPPQATISDLLIDFQGSAVSNQDSMTISGNAPNLAVVNTFVDTLEFTTYTVNYQPASPLNAFSSVVLAGFNITGSTSTYSITLNFDPTIFDNSNNVTLNIGPNQPQADKQEPSIIFSKGS